MIEITMPANLNVNAKSAVQPWLSYYKPQPQAKLRLFCFPYAGGSALIYRRWTESLPPSVEVCPFQLAGRGTRMAEPPQTHLLSLAQSVYQDILPMLNKPFVFFGHSMGALLSFELTRLLRRARGLTPEHLFVSAAIAPHRRENESQLSELPDDELLMKLYKYNGTPKEVLDNEELMQLLLPLLRADFKLLDTYDYIPEPPLECPLTVFGGAEDKAVKQELLEAWREQTTGPFTLKMLPGDHFFIQSEQSLFLQTLSKELHRITDSLS